MGRLQNNLSIGWVHPKSTYAHPLAWGNNKDTIGNLDKWIPRKTIQQELEQYEEWGTKDIKNKKSQKHH